jgi:glycosyltransferase involved in cell wall biosynthesis
MPSERLRILDVSPKVVLPPESGSRVRIFNLLLHLSERNDVHLFSQARTMTGWSEASSVVELSESFAETRHCSAMSRLVSNLVESRVIDSPALRGAGLALTRPAKLDALLQWADVVLVEFPWQLAYCRRRAPEKPLVLASHNIEASKFASYAQAVHGPRARHRWRRQIEAVERRAVAAADLVLAVSPQDRSEFIRRYGASPDSVVVIPNGADTSQYVPADPPRRRAAKQRLGLTDRPTVIFVGGNSAPNWAGLSWVRRLSELTDRFTFLVVGEMSTGEHGAGLVAPGVVNDLAPYFAAADISICPIEFGGGTKIKLLESLAAGLPTVAFEESTHGLSLTDGEHVLVVEKGELEVLAALNRLTDDPALAGRLSQAGREHIVERFDWKRIAANLESALRTLLGETATRRSVENMAAAESADGTLSASAERPLL